MTGTALCMYMYDEVGGGAVELKCGGVAMPTACGSLYGAAVATLGAVGAL